MGRYPHLGPFELEGAADLEIARDALAATGTTRLRVAALSPRSAAARSSASSSPARWRRLRRCCCSTNPRRRSISATSSRSPRCCSRLNRERGDDDGRLDARPEPRGGACATRSCCSSTGRVLARGATEEVLTAANIRALYGVDADVQFHATRRPSDGGAHWRDRSEFSSAPASSPGRRVRRARGRRLPARAARRQHADPSGRVSSIGRCRSPTTSTRRSSSSPGCRACSPRRSSAARWRSPASCSRRCCGIRWPRRTRSASRPARRSARCSRSRSTLDFSLLRRLGGAAGQFRRLARRARHRLRAVGRAPARHVHDGAAARRRHADGASRRRRAVRAVPRRLHRDVSDGALADGIARRRVLMRRSSRRSCRWRPLAAGFATLPRVLDLISVGSESAAARGVDVARTERVALVSASLATGAAVSLAGPVSFVGIVVPHLVRLIVGADHRLVLPASALFGAAFLIGCDLVARTVFAPLELPVGIVTAIDRRTGFSMAAVPPRMKTGDAPDPAVGSLCARSACLKRPTAHGQSQARSRAAAPPHPTHRLARSGHDRDAVRDGRRRSAGRRQQLRPLSAGRRAASARRRPARSRTSSGSCRSSPIS